MEIITPEHMMSSLTLEECCDRINLSMISEPKGKSSYTVFLRGEFPTNEVLQQVLKCYREAGWKYVEFSKGILGTYITLKISSL